MCKVDLTTTRIIPHADCTLEKLRQVELNGGDATALNGEIARQSDATWANCPSKTNDLMERAHLAAYYNGISIDEDGNLILPDLKSLNRGERAVAELILAVMATTASILLTWHDNANHYLSPAAMAI